METILNSYRNRLNMSGTTNKEKVVNEKIKTFEDYLEDTPTREIITVDEKYFPVSIQTSKQNEKKVEKIVLAKLDNPLEVGTIFKWNRLENFWMCLTEHLLSIPAYKKFECVKCDENGIYWTYNGVRKRSNFYSTSSLMIEVADAIKNSIIYSEYRGKMIGVVPVDEDTLLLKEGTEFILKDGVFEIIGIDKITSDKLIFFAFTKIVPDSAIHDIENKEIDEPVLDEDNWLWIKEEEY